MLVALASAKSAPGVSTTARVLASVWPGEVVLVDADPAGGDLPLLVLDEAGDPLDPDLGLISLAVAARRGPADLHDHTQRIDGGLDVLCGLQSPEQLGGMTGTWPSLARVLAAATGTVVADVGRLLPESPALSVVQAADVLLMVARPTVEGYGHLRTRLRWLDQLASSGGTLPAVGVVLVASVRRGDPTADLAAMLAHARLQVPVVGVIADDPGAAEALGSRRSRAVTRSMLVRSARALVDPVGRLAQTRGFAHLSL